MLDWGKIKQNDAVYEIVRNLDDAQPIAFAMTRSTYLQLDYIQLEVANGPAYRRFNSALGNRFRFAVDEAEAAAIMQELGADPAAGTYPLVRDRGNRQDVVIISAEHFAAAFYIVRLNAKERLYRPYRARRLEADTGWRTINVPAHPVEYRGHYHAAWQAIDDDTVLDCIRSFLERLQARGFTAVGLVARSTLVLFTCTVHIQLNVDHNRLILLHIGR
jgi:hypothetical protein